MKSKILKKDLLLIYNNSNKFYADNYNILWHNDFYNNKKYVLNINNFKNNVCYSFLDNHRNLYILIKKSFATLNLKIEFLKFLKLFENVLDVKINFNIVDKNEETILVNFQIKKSNRKIFLFLGTFLRLIHEEHNHYKIFMYQSLVLMNLIKFLKSKNLDYTNNLNSIYQYLEICNRFKQNSTGHTLFANNFENFVNFIKKPDKEYFTIKSNSNIQSLYSNNLNDLHNLNDENKLHICLKNYLTIEKNYNIKVTLKKNLHEYICFITKKYLKFYFDYEMTNSDKKLFYVNQEHL